MTYEKFRLLDEQRQAQVLWLQGIPLELRRRYRGLKAELYALADFYVELFFDASGDPLYLKPFRDAQRLDPYIRQIPIQSNVDL
jgi:hypothetical protein